MIRVTLIALPGALGSTLSIPIEMLKAASDVARARRCHSWQLELTVASVDGAPVTLMGGLTVAADAALADCGAADGVFVPGFWGNPRAALRDNPEVVEWLKRGSTSHLCALTTGSYFLAEAGLLDGCDATTHWRFFDDFAARYPRVTLQRNRFITHSENRYCTGSVNAVRDVMLHLVSQLFTPAIAVEIARQFTHEAGPSMQAAILSKSPQDSHHDEAIAAVQSHLHASYRRTLRVSTLAELAQLSVRSFTRRFKQATGTTPTAYLQRVRLEEAQALLRDSNASVIEVCGLVGYRDTSHFIAQFKAYAGTTPGGYRRFVRAKLFTADSAQEDELLSL